MTEFRCEKKNRLNCTISNILLLLFVQLSLNERRETEIFSELLCLGCASNRTLIGIGANAHNAAIK